MKVSREAEPQFRGHKATLYRGECIPAEPETMTVQRNLRMDTGMLSDEKAIAVPAMHPVGSVGVLLARSHWIKR